MFFMMARAVDKMQSLSTVAEAAMCMCVCVHVRSCVHIYTRARARTHTHTHSLSKIAEEAVSAAARRDRVLAAEKARVLELEQRCARLEYEKRMWQAEAGPHALACALTLTPRMHACIHTHTLTHTGGYGQEGDCDSSSSAAYTPRDVSGTCVGAAAAAGGAAVNDFSKRHYLGGGLDSGRPHLPVDQTHAHVPAGDLSSVDGRKGRPKGQHQSLSASVSKTSSSSSSMDEAQSVRLEGEGETYLPVDKPHVDFSKRSDPGAWTSSCCVATGVEVGAAQGGRQCQAADAEFLKR